MLHQSSLVAGPSRAQEFTKDIGPGHPSYAPGLVSALARVLSYRWAPSQQHALYLNRMVPVSPAQTTGSLPSIDMMGKTYTTCFSGRSTWINLEQQHQHSRFIHYGLLCTIKTCYYILLPWIMPPKRP